MRPSSRPGGSWRAWMQGRNRPRLTACSNRQPGTCPRSLPSSMTCAVEWERAAWLHAGDPAGEIAAKRALVRWRLHALLAELTDDIAHFEAAVAAGPDLPSSHAALGCAVARAGRLAEALPHLRRAVADQPFDAAAARALFQVLADLGRSEEGQELISERRLLAKAAPQVVRPEPWFTARGPGRQAREQTSPTRQRGTHANASSRSPEPLSKSRGYQPDAPARVR